MKRIGFLGAYSIDNTGDQVLGYAVRQAFRERVPGAEHVLFAPKLTGDFWKHDWRTARGIDAEVRPIPADDSTAWAKGLDAVVIGGGELVRLEPDFRPFLLGGTSAWHASIPAAWNAVGAENAPAYMTEHGPFYRSVRECCEALTYVSVRNPLTARFLRRCGFTGEAHVVPDPTLLLSAGDATEGQRVLLEAGVDTDKFVIGLSVGTSLRDGRASHFYKDLLTALTSWAKREAIEIVLFPFGGIYGDAELQEVATSWVPDAKIVRAPLDALQRWHLIGALDFHVCTRYHAMLSAFAHDIPFMVLDEYASDVNGSSKIREFVVEMGLEGFYLCPYLSTRPRHKLANAIRLLRDPDFSFREKLTSMQQDLGAHFDAMAAALAWG